ncbi:MAG: hypothetical protein K0S07_1342 [Chlamydiales bacterium]|jgi:hypothetical protein|nr:hypothetical protein [Chlamydiales bacterium]
MHQSSVLIKLFIGLPLTAELKMHLQQSQDWKLGQLLIESDMPLIECRYQNKAYIGSLLNEQKASTAALLQRRQQTLALLQRELSWPGLEELEIVAFPQIFLS